MRNYREWKIKYEKEGVTKETWSYSGDTAEKATKLFEEYFVANSKVLEIIENHPELYKSDEKK